MTTAQNRNEAPLNSLLGAGAACETQRLLTVHAVRSVSPAAAGY